MGFRTGGSAKLEYDYIKVDDFNPVLLNETVRLSRHINMVKAGINYRFDWGGGLLSGD